MGKPKSEAAHVIARLLGTEGFTPHLSGLIRRYMRGRHASTEQNRRYKRSLAAFRSEIGSKLTPAQKVVLGDYLGKLIRMHFDAGLRIGMTAFLHDPTPMEQ